MCQLTNPSLIPSVIWIVLKLTHFIKTDLEKNIFIRIMLETKFGFFKTALGKPEKKVLLLMAGPLRGGGGKGPAIKGKKLFLELLKIVLPLKNKNYFTLDNLSKYGHITLKFVGRYFIWVVTIFSQK